MSIGKPEWETQRRIIKLLREQLDYKYLDDWSERPGNSNIEESLLTDYLKEAGYADAVISRAVYKLNSAASSTFLASQGYPLSVATPCWSHPASMMPVSITRC